MGASPPPKPCIPTINFCKDCAYFQQEWKSEFSDWNYCDYWHKDTRENAQSCDQFEKKLSNVERNGED